MDNDIVHSQYKVSECPIFFVILLQVHWLKFHMISNQYKEVVQTKNIATQWEFKHEDVICYLLSTTVRHFGELYVRNTKHPSVLYRP